MTGIAGHLATRRAAGLFDFSFMGLHEFREKEELQRLQTRNLDRLVHGQIAYTLVLEEDGAVRIDATVWHLEDGRFWLFAGKHAAYGGRDRSGEFAILALQGPASGRILARLAGPDAVRGLRYFHFTQVDRMIVGRIGYSGELGYELLVPAAEAPALRSRLLDAGRGEGVRECGWASADSLRIESGYVLFDREIDGRANPRELGLERLVHDRRGFQLKRKLVGLEILEGKPPEHLRPASATSECLSPTLGKRIALAYVDPDSTNPGTIVRLADGRAGRVAALPFYDPLRRLPRGAPL